jgi:hypothetical protein
MNTKTKVEDSDVSPYIKQRKVVLCRSGIQYYHRSELESFMTEDNRPPVLKEWYKEYRPANVVVRAKDLCASLPATKEHPDVWVNPKNWKELAGGTTDKEVTVVALDGESEGEIGLQSVITFYDESLHDYYEHNKEVSLGYTCRKHWVDNPEELGYDIILDEILEVNHIAITRAGRGGSSVAVIDSIIGGLKPMRTGIFSWLARNKQSDSKFSFGSNVLSALEKGKTESSLANEMESVLDSCSILKEGEAKDTLINAVKDCFDHKDKALDFKEALIEQLDTLYSKAQADSVADFDKTLDGCHSKDEEKEEEKTEDSDKEKEEETKDSDSEEKTEDSDKEKEEETKDSDSEEKAEDSDKKEESDVKDSLTTEKVTQMIKDSLADNLKPLILETVKECLGIKDKKEEAKGFVFDSKSTELESNFDYSSFLDC